MSNAVILTPTLFDAGTMSNVGSEVATLPGTFLQDPIIRPRLWRTQNLTANRFDIDLGVAGECGHKVRAFWLGYSNATPHRNQIVQTDDYTTTWTKLQLGTPAVDAAAVDPFEGRRAWKTLELAVNTEHYHQQVWTKPASESVRVVGSFYAMGVSRTWIMLKIAGSTSTNFAEVSLDTTGAGTTATSTGGTGFTVNDSGFEDKGNGWYRIWIDATTDASSAVRLRHNFLDDAGAVIYAGNVLKGWYTVGAQLEIYDENAASGPSVFVPVTTVKGALWKVLGDYDTADLGGGSEDYDSGWMNATSQPGDLSDRGWVHLWKWLPSGTLGYRHYRILISDADNTDTYFQASRGMIGEGWQLPLNPTPGWGAPTPFSSLSLRRTMAEFGELDDTRRLIRAGGEIWLPTIEDYNDYRSIIRDRGSSKDLLFVMDPTGGAIQDEMIYAAARLQAGRETAGGAFRARIDFEEL